MTKKEETKLEREFRDDFDLFYKDNDAYRKKVNEISDLLSLTGDQKLKNDYLPTYIVGNYEDNNEKYVIVSLNPGFDKAKNDEEEKLKNGSFDSYRNFILHFFELLRDVKYVEENGEEKEWISTYYKELWPYFATLVGEKLTLDINTKYDLYQKYLINIDLVPYHSEGFSLKFRKKNKAENEYIKNRICSILDFIKHHEKIKGIIFNGHKYSDIINRFFIDTEMKTVKVNKHDINLFTIDGIKCIQHNFQSNQRGFSNVDRIEMATVFLNYINESN